jgi:hypothetical protein
MGLEIHLFNQAALFRHLVLDGLHGCLEAGFRADIIPPGPLVLVIISRAVNSHATSFSRNRS